MIAKAAPAHPAPAAWSAGSRRSILAAVAIGAIGLFLAWRLCFVQDDAFIAFHYARNLVEGKGLTWFGERVEGYTDFLWVLWMALGLRLGADPVVWSWVGGLAAFIVAMHGVWRLGLFVLEKESLALVALILFVSNYSVLAFATGGLETMLQTALLVQAAVMVARIATASTDSSAAKRTLWNCVGLSLLFAAAILTRPDSLLPVVVLGGTAIVRARPRAAIASRHDAAKPPAALPPRRAWLAMVLPGALLIGGWLLWKLAYYGDVLPNTFYAKVRWNGATAGAGLLYLWRFFGWYAIGLVWLVMGLVWLVRRARRTPVREKDSVATVRRRFIWGLGLWLILWLVYLTAIGGDFMEFRLLVPITPVLFIFTVLLIDAALPRLAVPVAAAAAFVLAAASVYHARSFHNLTDDKRLDSIEALSTFFYRYPNGDFSLIGKALGEQLRGTDALLALHAVGAVPYYSRLRTVDMYGLNDRRIARHGLPAPSWYRRPGHQRQATIAEMRARGVNLMLADPTLVKRGILARPEAEEYLHQWMLAMLSFGNEPFGVVDFVAIPLPNGGSVLAWYLTPSPAIDAAAAAHGWERVTRSVVR